MSDFLEQAIDIAESSLRGHVDKIGKPQILHAVSVMYEAGKHGDDSAIVGVLHDVVEDTAITLSDIRNAGFSSEIVNGVDAVTRREGEPYFNYVRRAIKDPIGKIVKRADSEHNMMRCIKYSTASWLSVSEQKDFQRMTKKYRKVLTIIKECSPDKTEKIEQQAAEITRLTARVKELDENLAEMGKVAQEAIDKGREIEKQRKELEARLKPVVEIYNNDKDRVDRFAVHYQGFATRVCQAIKAAAEGDRK